jgi:hypothetical protein
MFFVHFNNIQRLWLCLHFTIKKKRSHEEKEIGNLQKKKNSQSGKVIEDPTPLELWFSTQTNCKMRRGISSFLLRYFKISETRKDESFLSVFNSWYISISIVYGHKNGMLVNSFYLLFWSILPLFLLYKIVILC